MDKRREAERLAAVEFLGDRLFRAYGVDEERIGAIRRWAVAWRDDIGVRWASDPAGKGDEPPRFDWDRYLDERRRR
ncbi:hypothetical protein [Cryptosporangium aurantiacum]|uniref:Uncharacterized protein n=1 Tax=Cryptosporangium aurantiacum TaxID=134849 RepID=A0A1M7REF1_9ACTN|nr:hypothetical protein [Cryptosporangium aurantiacum]SHN44529.1 hypothetical protein SAMN05443668_110246 [Cryptosporangium aurantiacum]